VHALGLDQGDIRDAVLEQTGGERDARVAAADDQHVVIHVVLRD